MSLLQLDRREFLDSYFDYRPGEHTAFIYPTQKGKTHFAYQALQVAMRQNPDLAVCSLMPKALSPATARWAEALQLREVDDWPPRKNLLSADPAGHVLWPKHRKDLTADQDRAQVAEKLRKPLHDLYWRGNSICFVDDVFVAAVLMGLNPECEQWWTAGSEGGSGLWSANQKPSGTLGSGSVSSFCYNSATHLFLGRDTDERNVRRFSEIGGGVDPKQIAGIVRDLRLFPIGKKNISEVLYLDQRGPYMCLVGP
jgi:hypothetical protein